MNRLKRECLAASLVLHTLLVVVLVVGSGFASRQKPTEEVALLSFFPDTLVDAPVQGGGEPATPPAQPATPPPLRPPDPPPQTPPPPRRDPDPPPRQPEPPKPPVTPPPKAPAVEKKPDPPPPRRIEPSLKPVTRPPDQARIERERAAQEQARQDAEARRLAEIREQRFSQTASKLQQNLSSSTHVSVPGTGGATYASYASYVDLIYRSAWAPLRPRETDTRGGVLVRVVIARDGTVLSSEIRRRSGQAAIDQSVQAALDRVRTIGRPFPEGSRDAQREFDIEFNLESTGTG